MTRDRAIEKVWKLRALGRDRAATGPERKLALERADDLIEKYALTDTELRVPEPPPRRPAPPPAPPPFSFRGAVVIINGQATSTTTSPGMGAFATGNGGIWVRIG